MLEPCGHAQAGRLAASRGTDDRDELAVADLEVDVLQRDELLAALAEGAADAVEVDGRHCLPVSYSPRRCSMRACSRRSAMSISKPTMPIAIIPAITVEVETAACPLTIR